MAIKYIDIFHLRPSKICPNWYFWFEKKPFGNPAMDPCANALYECWVCSAIQDKVERFRERRRSTNFVRKVFVRKVFV
jgi:hypothetical protein